MAIHPSLPRVALVAGATGLVGRECLRLLSNDNDLWHNDSRAAEARREFGYDEHWFLGYLAALPQRNTSGPADVRRAWAK